MKKSNINQDVRINKEFKEKSFLGNEPQDKNSRAISLTMKLKDEGRCESLARTMYKCYTSLYDTWQNLLTLEGNMYNLESNITKKQIGAEDGSYSTNIKRFVREVYPYKCDYYKYHLPVFYTIILCYYDNVDNIMRNQNNESHVSIFRQILKESLEEFLIISLNIDREVALSYIDSNDEHVVLACFVTLFNHETLSEDGASVLNEFNYIIDEVIYKNKYFELLKGETIKNEVSEVPSGLFIDKYYVLPNLNPCNDEHSNSDLYENENSSIRALLVCGPGYGKTSACRAILAACLCDEAKELHDKIKKQWLGGKNLKGLFPIYIDAKNINNYSKNNNNQSPLNLIDLVFTNKIEKEHLIAVSVIKKQLNKNDQSILLLLDGLDEVDINCRKTLTKLIKFFKESYIKANIIVTSRQINFDSYLYDENNEQTDAIIGLTKYQLSIERKRIAIVKKWADILGEDDVWAVTTERKISQNSYLSDLAKNPFFLAHMVLKIAENYEKPYKIIYEVVEKLIEKKRDKNKQDSSLVRKLLSYIAYDLFIKQSNNIPYQDLEEVITYAEKHTKINREEWKRLCEEIITGSGLMICNYDTTTYYFQEPIIQKFLAAEWLLKNLMDTYEDTYYEDNSKQKKYIYKENPKLFFIEQIEHRLDDLWKKTNPQTWTDIVTMMMIMPPAGWRNDFSDIVIEPIFTYLLQTNATSVEPKQIESICKILKAMCLEEFSTSELLMNEDVEEVRNNRIRLLRTLLSGIPGYYEKCCREWEAESKSIQNFYSANETEVK